MATIQFTDGMIGMDFVPYDPPNGLDFVSSAPSEWGDLQWGYYNDDEGWRVLSLTGDFTIDAKGIPQSGKVTGLQIHVAYLPEDDEQDYSVTGFSFDISLIRSVFTGKGDIFDPKNVFFRSILSGDDTITLQSSDFLAGDGWIVTAGQTMVGGDDKISLSSRNAKYASFLAGDALDLYGRLVGGKDAIQGGADTDRLWGDTSEVRKGASLTGGDDVLRGEGGDDQLYGDAQFNDGRIVGGCDKLYGGDGSDELYGDVQFNDGTVIAGRDFLYGEAGRDRLDGNGGLDALTGGKGSDTFVFTTRPNSNANYDKITDFSHADDTIELHTDVFGGLKAGTLEDFRFKEVKYGTQKEGVDKSDRILYDKDSGKLYLDRDGSGHKYAPVKFAEVKANIDITHDDFLIV